MKVKICGITNVESALAAIQSGADALGFVFAESKRCITPKDAHEIIRQLPSDISKIGVFVNETMENIKSVVKEAGLTGVQLHGNESPQFCTQFDVPVIKAFSIGNIEDLLQIREYPTDYVLLDSPKGKYHGGNGVVFDWSILSGDLLSEKKVILAGGLNEENVVEGIQKIKPYMVDVSSGVETEGKKDVRKIKRFINRAKNLSVGEKS